MSDAKILINNTKNFMEMYSGVSQPLRLECQIELDCLKEAGELRKENAVLLNFIQHTMEIPSEPVEEGWLF